MNWIGIPLDFKVEDWKGMIYLIVDTENNKKYIGKKTFWSNKSKPMLKTLKTKAEIERLDIYANKLKEAKKIRPIKSRVSDREKAILQTIESYKAKIKERQANKKGLKRRSIVESKWRDYYGSNDIIKDLVEKGCQNRFKRYVLKLCEDDWTLAYQEAKLQFDHGVLLSDEYYNGYICVKLYTKAKKKVKE